MENRPIYKGKLEDLLKLIPQLEAPDDGEYFLFVPAQGDANLTVDEECAVVFLLWEEDNLVPDEVGGMFELLGSDTIKSIIDFAYELRPNASGAEIIKAIENYISHDAFISFDDIE